MHFNDEDLIAYLNDASGVWRKSWIRRHLASCLQCRYRCNMLEAEIEEIVARSQTWQETDLIAIECAKNVFRERVTSEGAQSRRMAPTLPGTAIRRWWWVAAAMAAMVALGGWALVVRMPVDPLAKARSMEDRRVAHAAVRQEFTLTLSHGVSIPAQMRRIEVAFDPNGNRFSLVLHKEDGSLAYGLWRPTSDRALEYYVADGGGLRPLRPPTPDEGERRLAADLASGHPDMERTVVSWLEGRDAAPIRLSREGLLTPSLARLGRPGSIRDSEDRFMLEWRTLTMSRPSLLTLSIDASNYRPVSQSLRCEAAGAEVKLTLVSERQVTPGSMDATDFEPSAVLIMARREAEPPPLGLGFGLSDLLAGTLQLARGGIR